MIGTQWRVASSAHVGLGGFTANVDAHGNYEIQAITTTKQGAAAILRMLADEIEQSERDAGGES